MYSGSNIRGSLAQDYVKFGRMCQKCKKYLVWFFVFQKMKNLTLFLKSGHQFSQVILRIGSYNCGFFYGKVFGHLSSIAPLFDERSQKTDTFYLCSLVDCNCLGHTVRNLYQGQFRRISARLSRHINSLRLS